MVKRSSIDAGELMYVPLSRMHSQSNMTRSVKTVTRQVTTRELEALFEQHDFNAFPVVEKGKMLGIVTKFDFLRAFAFTTGQMVLRWRPAQETGRSQAARNSRKCHRRPEDPR
jgi:CBS-domain-containing membrane protein